MLDFVFDVLSGFSVVERTILVLAVSLGMAIVLEFVVLRVASRFVRSTESAIDDIVFEELRWPVVLTAALGGVYLLTQTPNAGTDVLGEAELEMFFGKPAASIIVLVWAFALNNVVNRAVESVDKTGKYDFAPVFSNVWTLTVILGAGFVVLTLWGIEITPLLGAAGIAGVAIGFAAKDTVANFFGGLALYFDDTYKIGDYIELDTGDAGTVVRVGIRSTTLLTRDELMVTVPNARLNSSSIINESAPQRRRRIRVPLSVAYGTDLDEFEDLLVDAALEESLTLDSPKPRMRFREFGDSGLEYELLCWVNTPVKRAKAKHRLNKRIYATLQDADVEIPYPQRDVTISNRPDRSSELANGVEASTHGPATPAADPAAVDSAAVDAAAAEPTVDGNDPGTEAAPDSSRPAPDDDN